MLLFVLRCLAKLPLPILRALAGAMGVLIYLCSANNRHTISSNLTQAGLSLSVRKVSQAIARGAADMLWVWFNSANAVAAKVSIAPQDTITVMQALSHEHATLLLTPHLGCFEALAKWITHQTPLTAMYRRPSKPWIARLIETARRTPQLTMASADASGVRLALKTLKTGGTLGILPDQVPKHGEGIWLPWFGRNAYTITLPAKLHLATAAHVYVICALPHKNGWQVVCEAITPTTEHSAEELTALLNIALERMVLRAPLHYAWSYTRYKGID